MRGYRLGAGVLGLVVAACSARPAAAFYFEGWPGSGVAPPVTLSVPHRSSARITGGPDDTAHDGHPFQHDALPPAVPEPAGVVLAAGGLAALGVRRLRRLA